MTTTTTTVRPLVYTAQDVARYCEVNLKTIHHWADAGKIAHHRTAGRHLRFRRNDLLSFLRTHGYPIHDELTSARPLVFLVDDATWDPSPDEIAKKLASRFAVRRWTSAAQALAHLALGEPDAIVSSATDPTWAGLTTVAALKAVATTSWIAFVVIAEEPTPQAQRSSGPDLVLTRTELARLHLELAKTLGVP